MVAAYGRQFLVEAEDGGVHTCVMRGKKGGVACGDHVRFSQPGHDSAVIESIEPRRNLLYRSDEIRDKLIAANLDQALIVVAAVPLFREELLVRCLIACEAAGIPAVIVLNKTDLPETAALARALALYAALGYHVVPVSAAGGGKPGGQPGDLGALPALAASGASVLVGASGMGKSSLLNRLAPQAGATVGDISVALDAGRHTTTHARLYHLPGGGSVIDSPGMQEFGLLHLSQMQLTNAFPEMRARAGQCRFSNCRHLNEPTCAVREAAARGEISPARLRVYESLALQIEAHARP